MTRKLLYKVAIAAAFTFGLTIGNADALNAREAESVVTILEQLAADTEKTVFYDDDAASEWLEIDSESSRLIPAAGFSEDSWQRAFDETMTGFIASIPRAEMERMMREFAGKLGELGQMTPELKQEVAEMLQEQMSTIDAIREQGARYQTIVAPYVERLRVLSFQQ